MKKNIIIFIIVFVGYLVGNSIYLQAIKDPTPGKAKRLACQKRVTAFEKSFDNKEIKKAQSLLKSGDVYFISSAKKAIYAKSKLFNYVSLKDADNIFQKELDTYKKSKSIAKEKLKLIYSIYENDIKDPGKKTKKSKLYAGYIWLEIKNKDNKLIYKVQIDFMDKKGGDIAQTLKCCIKSFATYTQSK